ncbi:exosome complex component RRP43 isoform X3 [Hyaena hyaena]|uniref:exosome complex component RRP43 isoform X3 n=1 Tax=Hyaena hyaena TaxID=95912 RepID=UPI001921574E|nr:exosome complex component RRP43 isoform X3 [Hyaena hyaena]XP_039109565.1 exosome complex component RRP43 isoform X3 [Hyaena hyaena]
MRVFSNSRFVKTRPRGRRSLRGLPGPRRSTPGGPGSTSPRRARCVSGTARRAQASVSKLRRRGRRAARRRGVALRRRARAGGKMAAGFKTVEPLEYYRRFLKENCRPDGRELGEFRTTTVNIGSISTADGSALVKLGNTTVICGIKAEFAAPPTDAPDKGYVVPNVDLPPLCSSRFRSGPPGEEAQVASQFVADVIENFLGFYTVISFALTMMGTSWMPVRLLC